MLRLRIKRWIHHKYKYINGTKGVISLFLALVILPFTTIAGSLVNAARVNSAVAIFDEALCNASNSTLGTYDDFLRKRFGLLAMRQEVSGANGLNQEEVSKAISDIFNQYMKENLKTLNNTYTDVKTESMGVYSLADKDILLAEIMEYSKYSVPIKLVEDGLSLNDMVSKLEKNLPFASALNFFSLGVGAADALSSLARDYNLLKSAIQDEEIAIERYNMAYNNFAGSVSSYISKKQEMETELARIQTEIQSKESEITSTSEQVEVAKTQIDTVNEQIENIKTQIEELEKEQSGNSEVDNSKNIEELQKQIEEPQKQIESYQKQIEELNKSNSDASKEYEKAKENYDSTKASYEEQLRTLRSAIDTSKKAYSAAISTLSGKLGTVGGKLSTVQSDIAAVGTAFTNGVTAIGESVIKSEQKKNNEKISDLKEQLKGTEDEETKAIIQNQIDTLNESNTGIDNQNKVLDAQKDGTNKLMQEFKTEISKFNVSIYSEAAQNLMTLKQKVDAYGKNNVDITENINKSEYYVTISGLLTHDAAKKAEENLVKECTKSAVWSTLKAIAGFIDALFHVSTLYTPKLAAVIDTKYYKDTYGGLPSEKSRTTYPLNYGDSKDSEKSEEFKKLFGSYSSADIDATGEYDLLSALGSLASDVKIITTNATAIMQVYGLLNFAQRFHEMADAVGRIVDTIKGLIQYAANAFLESTIGSKLLLSGYASYMTSNRVTYTDSNGLTGQSFNLRRQETSAIFETNTMGKIGKIEGFKAIVDTLHKAVSGGTEKSFVGAETEYLLCGSKSELINQIGAFACIYVYRLAFNVLPVLLLDPQVKLIAAGSTLAAPFVYLLYMIAEPLVDTIILVNGGNIPMIKQRAYLTPNGILCLAGKFSELKLTSDEMDDVEAEFKESISEVDVGEIKALNDKTFFDMDYTQTLFLIMSVFTSKSKMLDRLSNIIEMEAVEYKNNVDSSPNKLFDLDYSYTYIRTQASFTTNEFIKLSNKQGINCKERIVYKGY